jgi:CubicO group peptidase (beta-lactamase class C family)
MAPAFEWQEGPPESQGFAASALEAIRDELAARQTRAFLVVRRDCIVCEWYAPGWHAGRPHFTASLAKAIVGGLSLQVALEDGRLAVDDPAARFVPQWRDDPQKRRITIRHLATHSSGLEDAEQDGLPHEQLPGWKGRFWRRDPDPFTIARDEAPVLFPPGTQYAYSNPGMAMLAYCVTAALRDAPQQDLRALLRERVYEPVGLRDGDWSIGYGATYWVDGLPLVANWGGGSFTARAVARLGRLMLRRGDWDGRRVLDAGWAARAVAYAGTPLPPRSAADPRPASGLGWWTNEDGVWPDVPRDAFAGAGASHQVLLVVPSLELIVVRNGRGLEGERAGSFWGPVYRTLFAPLMAALR